MWIVFDDVLPMPVNLRAVVGVERFGDLVFQRRSRLDAMRAAAAAAGAVFVHLRTEGDRSVLFEQLPDIENERLFLLCPSHLIPTSDADLKIFLQQITYAPMSLSIPLEGSHERQGWLLLSTNGLQKFLMRQNEHEVGRFYDEHYDTLAVVRDRLTLLDVRDERTMQNYLSGQFDARHFNVIEHKDYTVTKKSKDREKLRREYELYRLLPPSIQMFFVQPFDFQDDGETASYSMERLVIPDMALQWVHSGFHRDEFERFLKHIFHFIAIRPERRASRAEMEAVRRALYVEKVATRIAALKQAPAYAGLAPLLQSAFGGVDVLVERYLAAYERMRKRFSGDELVIGHGDLCFSNILYSKTNQSLKLIDPRGATGPEDVYTDPYYDVAKLSHSILGGYDFINQDKFEVTVDEALRPRLSFETKPPPWARPLFAAQLEALDFELELVRLCEASLFISMLPLHIDRPRKVLGFALTASAILDSLPRNGR